MSQLVWNDELWAQVVALREQGMGWDDIEQRMGISSEAMRARMRKLNPQDELLKPAKRTVYSHGVKRVQRYHSA